MGHVIISQGRLQGELVNPIVFCDVKNATVSHIHHIKNTPLFVKVGWLCKFSLDIQVGLYCSVCVEVPWDWCGKYGPCEVVHSIVASVCRHDGFIDLPLFVLTHLFCDMRFGKEVQLFKKLYITCYSTCSTNKILICG
jgi:hypothetical protein